MEKKYLKPLDSDNKMVITLIQYWPSSIKKNSMGGAGAIAQL